MKFLCLLLALAVTAPASAAILYSGLRNIPIPTTQDGVHLDLDTGTTSAAIITGWDFNPFFGGVALAGNASFQPARNGTGNEDPVRLLPAGTPINSTLLFSTGETGSSTHLGAPGNFQPGVEGYLGFRWVPQDSATPLYGWMRLTLTGNTPGAFIHDWAWESTGAPLQAAQIPEPSAPILLLAAMSLLSFRRRR